MNKKANKLIGFGAFLMAIGIALGAYGAHGLKNIATSYEVEIFNTAVQYHMFGAIGLMIIGIIYTIINDKKILYSGYLMVFGILAFSGPLYTFVLGGIYVGIITPIGGSVFVLAWLLFGFAVMKNKKEI